MAPKCRDNMYQLGNTGHDCDFLHLAAPDPAVDICPGDFLTAITSATGISEAQLLSDWSVGGWTTDLATTLPLAVAAFVGVSAQEYGTEECITQPDCLPYHRKLKGNGFRRPYEICDASGVAAPTTWRVGDGFTFAKDPSGNVLLDNKVTKTSTANQIVFRAVNDSGPDAKARVLVEFA